MIESTARAERFDLQSPTTPSYLWEVPQKPLKVRLPFDLIDRLEGEAVETFRSLNARGSEIGGILFGTASTGEPATVSVEHYELISCDYSRGPLYRLSDADFGRFDRAIAQHGTAGSVPVAGFFRSHTRKGLALDPEDLILFETRFKDPRKFALLIRPFATKASSGGIFIWEGGSVKSDGSYLEFPFRSSQLAASKPITDVDLAAAGIGGALPAPTVPKTSSRAQIVPIASRREINPPAQSLTVEPPATAAPAPAAPPPPPAKPVASAIVAEPPAAKAPAPPAPSVPPQTAPPSKPAVTVKPAESPAARTTPSVTVKATEAPAPKPAPAPVVTPKATEAPAAKVAPAAPAAKPVEAPAPKPAPAPVAKTPEAPAAKAAPEPAPKPAPKAPEVVKPTVKAPEPPAAKAAPEPAIKPAPKTPEAPKPVAKTEEPAAKAPAAQVEELAPIRVPKLNPSKSELKKEEQAEEASEAGASFLSGKMTWIAIGAAVALVVLVLFVYPGVLRRSSQPTAGAVDNTALSLRVERAGGELQLIWNRDSDPVRGATSAVLSITDGDQHQDVPIDLAQLQKGSVSYTPATSDVVFRMEVMGKNQNKTASELVRAIRPRPSPIPENNPAANTTPTTAPNTAKPASAPNTPATAAAPSAPAATEPAPVPEAVQKPQRTLKPFQAESLSARLHPSSNSDVPDAPSLGRVDAPGVAMPNLSGSVQPPPPAPPKAAPAPVAPAPAAAPEKKAPTGGQLQQAQLVHRKEPEYPRLARETGARGTVELIATIGTDGRVKKVQVVKGHPMLVKAASDAVMQWQYKPTILNGTAVEAQTQVLINFSDR